MANKLIPSDIAKVETLVHQGAIDVLESVTDPTTVHQSKFSMGTVLALVAYYQFAGLQKFECHLNNGQVLNGRVDEPKGDPGNTLTRAEITDKAMRLAAYSKKAPPQKK